MGSGVKGMSTQPRGVPVRDGGLGFWSHTVGVCTRLILSPGAFPDLSPLCSDTGELWNFKLNSEFCSSPHVTQTLNEKLPSLGGDLAPGYLLTP